MKERTLNHELADFEPKGFSTMLGQPGRSLGLPATPARISYNRPLRVPSNQQLHPRVYTGQGKDNSNQDKQLCYYTMLKLVAASMTRKQFDILKNGKQCIQPKICFSNRNCDAIYSLGINFQNDHIHLLYI